MQNRQSGRRRRGGGGGSNNPRPMGMASGGQGANRLEVRVRGNAHQLLEKYKQLARDAHQAGDRVAAEYYLQHSDHYFRVLNDSRIRQEEMRARRGVFDLYEDEPAGGEGEDGQGDGGEEQADGGEREAPRQQREDRGDRGDRRPRPEYRDRSDDRDGNRDGTRESGRDGGDRQRWQERRPERARDEAPRDDVPSDDRPRDERVRPDKVRTERPREPREVREGRLRPASSEPRLSDGEAALVAFGGPPAREVAEPAAEAEPPKRRRGRPRKVEAEPADG